MTTLDPCGWVRIEATASFEHDMQLRLLHLTPETGRLRHELSRRSKLDKLNGGSLLMPEGPTLASIWDPREKRYVALSRPFEVRGRSERTAPLETPQVDTAYLVVYVDRPPGAASSALVGVALTVSQSGKVHPADVQHTTPWGSYSVWYDLHPGIALLEGGNEHLYLAAERLTLAGGQIARFRSNLSKRLFPAREN